MLRHQLGQDLVLGLHLLLQELNPFLFLLRLAAWTFRRLEGGRSDLCEELGLQPTVFYRWQKEFFENGAETGTLSRRWRLRTATFSLAACGASLDSGTEKIV